MQNVLCITYYPRLCAEHTKGQEIKAIKRTMTDLCIRWQSRVSISSWCDCNPVYIWNIDKGTSFTTYRRCGQLTSFALWSHLALYSPFLSISWPTYTIGFSTFTLYSVRVFTRTHLGAKEPRVFRSNHQSVWLFSWRHLLRVFLSRPVGLIGYAQTSSGSSFYLDQ